MDVRKCEEQLFKKLESGKKKEKKPHRSSPLFNLTGRM